MIVDHRIIFSFLSYLYSFFMSIISNSVYTFVVQVGRDKR